MKDKLFSREMAKLLATVIMILILFMGSGMVHLFFPTFTLTIDGKSIKVGESTLQVFTDDGYQISDREGVPLGEMQKDPIEKFYDPDTLLDGNTTFSGLYLIKDGAVFAYLNIQNENRSDKRLGDCVIMQIILYQPQYLDSVKGIPAENVSVESLKDTLGDYKEQKKGSLYDDTLLVTKWNKGGYVIILETKENNEISSISVRDERIFK